MVQIICCKKLQTDSVQYSPFGKILSFDYYDGPIEGFALCQKCNSEYKFNMKAWDKRQDTRIYAFSPLPIGSFFKVETILNSEQKPTWPIWVPRWQFKNELLKRHLEDLINGLTNEVENPAFILAAENLASQIIAFTRIENHDQVSSLQDLKTTKDWFEYLHLE